MADFKVSFLSSIETRKVFDRSSLTQSSNENGNSQSLFDDVGNDPNFEPPVGVPSQSSQKSLGDPFSFPFNLFIDNGSIRIVGYESYSAWSK